jgi:hypothetical protein
MFRMILVCSTFMKELTRTIHIRGNQAGRSSGMSGIVTATSAVPSRHPVVAELESVRARPALNFGGDSCRSLSRVNGHRSG